jgi:hypothetical protein
MIRALLAIGPIILTLCGPTLAGSDLKILNLTGTWEGLQVCDDNEGGEQVNFVTDDRVEISQRGHHLRLRRVNQSGGLIYDGRVLEISGSTRVEAMVSVCDGTYVAREMVRLRRVRATADGSGSFDAESLYESTDALGFEGVQIFGTCKWAYERVSTKNPRVPAC